MFQRSDRAVMFLLVLNATSPAMAGLFTTALSPDDALQLKHVAVVSVLGDTLHAREIGLTVFQNKSFDASVPDWRLMQAYEHSSVHCTLRSPEPKRL